MSSKMSSHTVAPYNSFSNTSTRHSIRPHHPLDAFSFCSPRPPIRRHVLVVSPQVRCRNKHEELFDRIWKPLFSTDCELQHAVAGPGQLIAAWLKNTNVEAVFCSYLVERLFTPMDNDQTAVLR